MFNNGQTMHNLQWMWDIYVCIFRMPHRWIKTRTMYCSARSPYNYMTEGDSTSIFMADIVLFLTLVRGASSVPSIMRL